MARPTKKQQAARARRLYKSELACWRAQYPEQSAKFKAEGKGDTSVAVRLSIARWKACDPEGTSEAIKIWHEIMLKIRLPKKK